jgi:subtilisin family serine protease
MDGKTSLVAKAAAIAASKGILVVNSMGNDGNNKWQYMCTPADVENVMAVGGIDPNTGIHIPFSSFGPTSDKRMKPNVSAYAHVVTGSNNKITEAYGTSFASPLVAGFAACVLQMHPEYNFDSLFTAIEKSGNLYPYYDYAHGYGIPQAGYFLDKKEESNSLLSVIKLNQTIVVNSEDEGGLMYYHIQSKGNVLEKYGVVEISGENTWQLPLKEVNGKILRVHYKGYTVEEEF